jgi:hypothetical protein
MMAVSASEPQPGVAQLRGVPSWTVRLLDAVHVLEKKMKKLTRETGHGHAISTLDLSEDTVGGNGGGSSRNEGD